MKVLVTGATGYIGNYLIHDLLEMGVEVIASSTNEARARQFPWYKNVIFVSHDIGNSDESINLYEKFYKPDRLIHLAWSGLPNYKSLSHIEVNLLHHIYFLKNLISNGLRDLNVSGTCFEYGIQNGELREDMDVYPANPYAFAKNALRVYLEFLQIDTPFVLKWIRLFYMYGEGQGAGSLFSQLENALASGQQSFNMSPGQQIRDFMPINEVSQAIIRIALQEKITGIINCSSNNPVTVESFVESYLEKIGKKIHLNLGYYPYSDIEPMYFWGDNSKLNLIK